MSYSNLSFLLIKPSIIAACCLDYSFNAVMHLYHSRDSNFPNDEAKLLLKSWELVFKELMEHDEIKFHDMRVLSGLLNKMYISAIK